MPQLSVGLYQLRRELQLLTRRRWKEKTQDVIGKKHSHGGVLLKTYTLVISQFFHYYEPAFYPSSVMLKTTALSFETA